MDVSLDRVYFRLSQLSSLTGIKRHTLNARLKSLFNNSELKRSSGNQIILEPHLVKKIISNEMLNATKKIIFIGNLKGGVGKTTLAYILSEVLSNFGLKVCAIDLDVQANLTNQYLDIKPDQSVFFDLIEANVNVKDLPVNVRKNLDIIPSSLKNSLIQKALTMQSPKHHVTWLNSLCLDYLREHYDIIIVDTPPSLSTLNSVFCLCLNSNDSILIPVAPEEFSILGVKMFMDDVIEIRKSYNITEDVDVTILMNRFFQNQKSNLEILVKMTTLYGNMFSSVILRDFSKIRELINKKLHLASIKSGKDIYEFINGLLLDLKILKGGEK